MSNNNDFRFTIRVVTCWSMLLIANVVALAGQPGDPTDEQVAFFESKVRPLFESRCLECHSQKTEMSGGLALDTRQSWLTGGDSGPAISIETWQTSLLWKAVEYRNPHLKMPPQGKLTDAELAILEAWLKQGAYDPRTNETVGTAKTLGLRVSDAQQHWAYRKIESPSERSTPHSIDAFLAIQQQELGLQVSPKASLPTLVQRLHLDLHGMRPPFELAQRSSIEEESIGYEALVDELLASPRFGERFARNWMDVVRFAESITLRGFVLHDAWRFRNYVIHSFQCDKPIHEFIREQIAGDLIQSGSLQDRQEQLTATTMLALGDTNLEEQDKKQLEMDFVDEQLDVIGKAFLAQTISCARCHDHKFDPIPTQDYYALAGILKSSVALEHANVSNWIRRPLPLERFQEEQYERVESRIQECKKEIEGAKQKLQEGSKSPLIVALADLTGIVVDDSSAKRVGSWDESTSIATYVGSGYLHDQNNNKGAKSVTFEPKELPSGTYRVRVSYSPGPNRATNTLVRIFSAEGEATVRVNQRSAPKDDGLWHTLGNYRFEASGQAFVIVSNEDSDGHVIADAIQFLAESSLPKNLPSVDEPLQNKRDELPTIQSQLQALELELKELQAKLDERPMVISIRPSEQPLDLAIHIRGSAHQLGKTVPRGFLSCLPVSSTSPAIDSQSNGRLELANWMVHRDNPLTARVYVNRVWAWLMGQGLVRTLDNFGTTGEPPSHPELLDWLTLKFVEHNWSTKWLVREIVCSDAYQRSSRVSSQTMTIDPDNRYLARGHVRRLDAEAIRDTLLNLSGELELSERIDSMIPSHVKEDYAFLHGSKARTVYGPWFRNSLPELFVEFDGANPCFSISKRLRSTIAQQSLAFLNSDWINERCKRIGQRASENPFALTQQQKIDWCFQTVLNRPPTEQENRWATRHWNLENSDQENAGAIYTELVHALVASLDFRFIE